MSGLRKLITLGSAVAAMAALLVAGPAGAASDPRINLRVLVLLDGSPGAEAVAAQLEREGVPYDSVDLRAADRPRLTGTTLADAATGKYQGVVVPTTAPPGLTAEEASALVQYEREYGVRRIVAYAAPTADVGLTHAWSGTLDGATVSVTPAGRSGGFGYLAGQFQVDDRDPAVSEAFGYLGTPGASFTPLLTAVRNGASGPVAGVHRADGREQLVLTLAANRYQTHFALIGHGLVTWLTRGVHLGHWRNWFSVHVDDVLLPNNRWHAAANCTVGSGCNDDRDPAAQPYNELIRMRPSDVDYLVSWQRRQGLKLDLAYNAEGAVEAGSGDRLTAALLAKKSEFRWINHTYSHAYLGCVKDHTVNPWRCTRDASGAIVWASEAEISAEVKRNVDWARARGVSVDERELVTGEHSGLRSLPQVPEDNPNLARALSANGVVHLASDASREFWPRTLGPVRTVPRYPMSIYYNTATRAEAVDEYNWIYNRRADGGSGICEDNPQTSTCIAPLPAGGFDSYIVPFETRVAFDHTVSVDPRPHYAHQSNLTEDRILYPVLDGVLARYRATFTAATPLVNPRFAAVSQLMRRQQQWREAVAAGTVTGYRQGDRVTVVNTGAALDAPITVPPNTRTVLLGLSTAEFGQAYGGQRSAWHLLRRGDSITLDLPA